MRSGIVIVLGALFFATDLVAVDDSPFQNKPERSTEARKQNHVLATFLDELSLRISSFEKDYQGTKSRNASDRLLSALVKDFGKELKDSDKILELSLNPELKKKLEALKVTAEADSKEESKELTFGDLKKILDNRSKELTPQEKSQLAAMLLTHFEAKHRSAGSPAEAVKNLLQEYLETMNRLAPEEALTLPEGLKKHLGLEESKKITAADILKKIKEKGLPTNVKESLDVLTTLIDRGLKESESLDTALSPIWNQMFQAERSKFKNPEREGIPSTFADALQALRNQQSSKIQDWKKRGVLGSFAKGGRPNGAGGGGGKKFHRGGAGGKPVNSTPTPMVDSVELKACVEKARERAINVELSLPGALCASTGVSTNPEEDIRRFRANVGGMCKIMLSTALHCIEEIGEDILLASPIGIKIEGEGVSAQITKVRNPDLIASKASRAGKAVEGGNPDLVLMDAQVPCDQAARMTLLRVPTPEELNYGFFQKPHLPLFLKQNSEINADPSGINGATIAATGAWETWAQDNSIANSLKFNSDSRNNQKAASSGDSNGITQGDSGGTAGTCIPQKDGSLEMVYVGAISNIEVRDDGLQGTIGGIASGQSLLNLSDLLYPKNLMTYGEPRKRRPSNLTAPNHPSGLPG